MPTLRQLRYLVAVTDTLNFRRAAQTCHVSQPTLSAQLRALEERLEVQLVERSRHRVLLTPIGREIAARSREVLSSVQDIIDIADRGRHILEGMLKLGVLPSLGPYLLPHVLPYLKVRYPKLALYLREDTAGNLLRQLDDGDLDLLIFPLPVTRDGFDYTPLFDEPLLIAFPRDHPLARKEKLRGRDLRGETILALEQGHSLHETVLDLAREHGAKPLLDFETTSLDTLRQMATMGVGATFLPALYVKAEAADDPEIVVRHFSDPEPKRCIGLVWRKKSARRSEYLALATHIRDALAESVHEVTLLTRG